MPRPRTLALGALALLLAGTPFIPRGGGDDGSLRPSGREEYAALAATAGAGRVTPGLRAEVDRVVSQGLSLGRLSGKQSVGELVAGMVRCADFEGQRYCLNSGWTESTQAQVQARTATAARAIAARPADATTSTGDLDVLATLRRRATLTPTARATAERAELTSAARSVAKVWLLRHQIEGVPIPVGFLERHPEARATAPVAARSSASTSATPTPSTTAPSTTARTRTKRQRDYPERRVILKPAETAEQRRTYWCGPTTMQMIAWGWRGYRQGQGYWAGKLGTTSGGTAITDMVRVVNANTGWDRRDHAGAYITLDIADYSFNRWVLLTMRHIVDYRAPLLLHPILLTRFYSYLDDDASGHFQVGRGYDKSGDKPTRISYFEPWNQQRFDPSEPFIGRLQWRSAYKSYRANQAHFQHNIGV